MEKYDIELLYVEDDDQLRKTYSRFFARRVQTLQTAENGRIGLEKFKDKKPDLVITDLKMPIMDGIELIESIRKIDEEVTIIVTSAFNDSEYLIKAIEKGVSEYLIKPFKRENISTVFTKAVERILLKRREEKHTKELKAVFVTSIDGIAIADSKTNFVKVNQAFIELSGYSERELQDKSCVELSGSDIEKENVSRLVERVIENDEIIHLDKGLIQKSGNKKYVNVAIKNVGFNNQIIIRIRNITQEKIKKKELEEYVRLVDENILSISTNLEGRIVSVSSAFLKTSKFEKEELIGQKCYELLQSNQEVWKIVTKGNYWRGEVEYKDKNGNIFTVFQTVSAIYDLEKEKIGYTSIKHDISDKKKIEVLSITDRLTGLYNRLKLDEVFYSEIEQVKDGGTVFSILIADIDKFKSVNDNFGHQTGDSVLKDFAQILQDNVRKNGVVGRWGGEEFLIILPNTKREEIQIVSERIRQEVANFTFKKVGRVTASFGGTAYLWNDTQESMVERADRSLYEAKETGRNRTIIG
jgi:diguanylate cyclase (GGDEF)-like protein/PAS domain S-box-containing protein